MLEENIVRRLKNGINEDSFKLSENQDIYQLMMARTFSNQYTRIVYIPEEFVTYYANDYHKNGIGKSITYGLTYLSSLRAMTRLAKVTGMLKTAIPITRVNVTFAEDDPDPHATAEMIAHDVLRYKAPPLPIGNNSPQMLADFLVRSGIEFNFEGSERFPGTKIEFETKSLQHSTPDDSTDDDMRKQQYMAMGVSPEMVDNGFSPEHATTVTKNHLLLSRRVITHQNKFEPSLAQEGRKSLQFDSLFLEEAHRVIEDNKGLLEKYLSDDFLPSCASEGSNLFWCVITRRDKSKWFLVTVVACSGEKPLSTISGDTPIAIYCCLRISSSVESSGVLCCKLLVSNSILVPGKRSLPSKLNSIPDLTKKSASI
jgi:hypothetical protein